MTQLSKSAILAELQRRKDELEAKSFKFDDFCFDKQLEFFRGPGNRFRTAVCSRRAGKTVGIAADAIDRCLHNENINILYITLTQQNARNIIWGDLMRIVEDNNIKCKVDNVRLTIKFPNKSRLVIAGAKDRQEIEKYRGWKLDRCYIDECQSFRPYIQELIKDILTPALRDLRGNLYLTGTPGPIPAGAFYDYSHSDKWDNHHWTAYDNPHMHNPPEIDLDQTLTEERELFDIDVSDPGYQRETYGRWVEDKDSLVFKLDRSANSYESLPEDGNWTFVLGIDIGYNDADALAILGYNDTHKKVYLVEELVTKKQNITGLVEQIQSLQKKYNPVKMVIDAGALGKKIQEEILYRHRLPLIAAEKTRKVEFIELLNDDLRTNKLLVKKDSVFAEDAMLVQWDRESKLRNPEKPKISRTYHSDITDAVLYAWRECRHYLSELPPPDAPHIDSEEYMNQLEFKFVEQAKKKQDKTGAMSFYDGNEGAAEELDRELDWGDDF